MPTALRVVSAALVLLGVIGCAPPAGPASVRFIPVDLPAGATPQMMVAAGQELLLGLRYDGQPPRPGIMRLGPDGSATELTVVPASGYGKSASWYSLALDGRQVVGIGGDRGGSHGNVRWSVWNGSDTAVHEQPQAFSTFGGWGAGDLIDAVPTPAGPVVVGTWQSADAGLDVAVWTSDSNTDSDTWARRDSTGTPLASTRAALGFPTDATAAGQGVLVVGWELTRGAAGPTPVAWQSATGHDQWTRTPLPDAGTSGGATAVRCADGFCAVSGRADGALALWRLTNGTWTRVAGVPAIPVGDDDPLPAPLIRDGSLTQIVSDGPDIKILTMDGTTTTERLVEGPVGAAVSAVDTDGSIYLLTRPDAHTTNLWRADTTALR